MREIEFRGLDPKSGELVKGDLIHGVGDKCGKVFILPIRVNLAYVKNCDPLDGVEVDPESVGQFTGLLDKNGKKIFEGDVIKSLHTDSDRCGRFAFKEFTDSLIGVVIYNEIMAKYELKMEDNEFNIYSTEIGWSHEDFEIIGNVTENPELLK